MPYYSDEIIEQVRDANDIVDVIGQYVRLKKKGANYFGLCPFHSEKTASFSVSRERQMYHCFGCGVGGSVFHFIEQYENMTFPEAVHYLADRGGVTLPTQEMSAEARARSDKRSRLLEINREAGKYFYRLLRSEHGQDAHAYFAGRGLSEETMQRFGLGYADAYSNDLYAFLRRKGYNDVLLKDSGLCTIDEKRGGRDKFWNRAMFPIMDANAKVIAFGGRVMGEGEPKYLNSPETEIFNKSRTLYGLHLAKRTREKAFILCEGYMDVIALHQAGFDNALASLGTAMTEGHAGLIRRYVTDVYLSYDSDGAGQKAALRAIPILRAAGIACRVINMSPHKDPDEFIKALGADAYRERIAQAENAFLYEIRMSEREFDLHDPGGKSRFAESVAARIVRFAEQVEREAYRDAIVERYGISKDALDELIRRAAAQGGGIGQTTVEERRRDARRERREDIRRSRGDVRAQKLLLRWLAERPDAFAKVRAHVAPEDFDEGVFRAVAEAVYGQLADSGTVQSAAILNAFTDSEDITLASSIFFEEVAGMEEDDPAIFDMALSQAIVSLKCSRLDDAIAHWDESNGGDIQALLREHASYKNAKGKNLFDG